MNVERFNAKTNQSPNHNQWDTLTREDQWDTLTRESVQNKHLTQEQMASRIKQGIEHYKESIQPFVDRIEDDTIKTFIKDYEDEDYPLFAIDQGFLHELESALRLKNKIELWHDEEPGRDERAWYRRGKNEIILNDNFAHDTGDAFDFISELSTLAHETFHAYQYEQELYGDKESSERYKELHSSYTMEDCITYCDTPIELEAYCFENLIGHKILKNMHEMGRHTDLGIH